MRLPVLIDDRAAAVVKETLSDTALWELVKDDPIFVLLLSGEASTVHEAETKFLSENVETISRPVLELVESDLTDEEFGRHPLILLLRGHGSRRWENSVR